MHNAFSTDYTYSLCEKCQAANCCSAYAIPLTAFDVLRYSISFNITPKEFMLKYTVDSYEDRDFIKTNEYIQKYYKDEKVLTFLARRIPYAYKASFCIFIIYDKKADAMRCASYNCRSDACRVCYADHCMTQGATYESVIYSKALIEEKKLASPYLESEYVRGLYNLAEHSYKAREEFKKGFAGFKFEYDIKKYQLDINEKLLRFEKYLNDNKVFYKDINIDKGMIEYPKYLNSLSNKNYKTKPDTCWYTNKDIPTRDYEVNAYLQPVVNYYRINSNNLSDSMLNGLRFIDSYVKYFPVLSTEESTINAKIKIAKLLNKALSITNGDVSKYINLIIKDLKKDLKSKYPLSQSPLMKVSSKFEKLQKNDGSWRTKVASSTSFREKTYLIFCETISMVCCIANNKG